VTHVLNMQIEFDDEPLAEPHGIPGAVESDHDDFFAEAPGTVKARRRFCAGTLDEPEARPLRSCAAGVHRAPMMTLAVLCAIGMGDRAAIDFD